MKYVVGIIPGRGLKGLTRMLGEAGIYRLTVSEIEIVTSADVGRADSSSPASDSVRHFGGVDPLVDDVRLRVEIAVNDGFLDPALAAFLELGCAAESVSVFALEDVVRIRTDERGSDAI